MASGLLHLMDDLARDSKLLEQFQNSAEEAEKIMTRFDLTAAQREAIRGSNADSVFRIINHEVENTFGNAARPYNC